MASTRQLAETFQKVPFVNSHIDKASEAAARLFSDAVSQELWQRLGANWDQSTSEPLEFDSALEAAFWCWWIALSQVDIFAEKELYLRRHVEVVAADQRYVIDFVVQHQDRTGPLCSRETLSYLLDHWPLIGIELDGHTFHEKTLEQVTYRNQRDRALQQAGWHVFHFSFSEFNNDPENCLYEVIEFARGTAGRLRAARMEQLRQAKE